VGGIGVLIVLLIVGLAIGGGSSKKHAATTAVRGATNAAAPVHHRTGPSTAPQSARVALSLHATATVYVCLLGDGGRKLIPGIELQPGATTPTYHARRFEITLGNNAVTMVLDGTARTVPASSRAIGYSITKGGGRRPLQPGQQPTCA
jgi:hypothetical protein